MNRLRDQLSPYLQQHVDDPVDWHPWGPEALALARGENKPILLSIGYSACHWCQRMAAESFQSYNVAKLMNDSFINVIVDREERPDLDRIYQTVHGILTRKPGGWPLNMFLDPHDQLPFFGGTYFPPQAGKNAPGFRDVLRGMAKTWTAQNEKIQDFKTQLHGAVIQTLGGSSEPGDLDVSLIDRACGQIDASFDEQHGGFSGAPKFPHPAGLELLHDVASSVVDDEKSRRARYMLDRTLTAMSRGGLYDHVGGGFFGFSVDADWTIPHFEKMLFDNGPLLSVFARGAQRTNSPWLLSVANRTADWMLREMQLDEGGFASSLAADLEGNEGGFYVWKRDAVAAVLGDDYDVLAEQFGLSKKANFGTEWHLRLNVSDQLEETLAQHPVRELDAALAALRSARDQRGRPSRDEKTIVSWNALGIRGLVDAALHLQRDDCTVAACRALDYVREVHWHNGCLFGAGRAGTGYLDAYLDDYAFLLDAVLRLLALKWRDADLAFATALADTMLARFEDPDKGGFYFTSHTHETLLARPKLFADDSMPAGNGAAVCGLQELGRLLGEPRFLDAAARTLRAGMGAADQWPSAHATLLRALRDHSMPAARVVLRYASGAEAGRWGTAVMDACGGRGRVYSIPGDTTVMSARCPGTGAPVSACLCNPDGSTVPFDSLERLLDAVHAFSA